MGEIRTVTTLRKKRDQIRQAIRDYEKKLDQARADLAHIAAAIAIFEGHKGQNTELPAYSDMKRLFRYGEGFRLCQEALQSGPKTTRELAAHIIHAKGLDSRDHVLGKVVCRHIIHQLRRQAQQGRLLIAGKKQAAL
ncbi:MAG TPA: hypothetical protein VFA57_02810, partial [Pseudolabrys sp.]|nr:hypothetical protein [Pseudolabrys sp.]